MSCNDGLFEHWVEVPANSRLEVKVDGDQDEFIAFGSLRVTDVTTRPKVSLKHSDLHPGPHATRFSSGVRQAVYSVNIQFTVVGGGQAQIRGRIVNEDGSVFDRPFCQAFEGTHGSTFGCTIGASR